MAAQTAAQAAVIAAFAAEQAATAATAATMSRKDVGFGGSHRGINRADYDSGYSAPVPFPARRTALRSDASCHKVQWKQTWHGGAQEWHGRHCQGGYIGTVRARPYKRQTWVSASKSRHVNVGGGKANDGQQRFYPRSWYKPQQPKGKHSNQKQTRFQPGKAGVSRATQTAADSGTQTVSPHNSKDVAFSAAEEIMKGCLEPEPELPQIFLLTGNDSDDDETAFFPSSLPCGPKSRWPRVLDGATTASSVSSADSFSQDSDEDNTIMA